jgi:PAS domain S-box-containing protein
MKNEGMFKELVENSEDIIIVTDPEFKIHYISPAVTKIFGKEPFQVLGRNVFDFVSDDKLTGLKKSLENCSETFSEEIVLETVHGKAYFDVQISNLLQHYEIRGLALRLHDITSKKTKEQELIRSNEQLDQVIYKTTHDLKAPLMSAIGLVTLAERASPDEKSTYINLIKKSLIKLDSLIEDMNNFFRNDKLALQRDNINVEELICEELENLNSLYKEHNIDVVFEINKGAELYSDSIRVKTVVTNILSNAIKYCDSRKHESFIRINISINEEVCEIRIEDNGIGIEAQYQAKIFDLFFRATNHSQGTGLGLFIVKDTIQKLKGTIDVKSTVGVGTTFLIRIPNQIGSPVEVA